MYIIIEAQTTNGTTSVLPVHTKSTRAEAESTFHSILSFAAVSSVGKHSAFMLTDDGLLVDAKCYKHEPQPAPEPEPTEE